MLFKNKDQNKAARMMRNLRAQYKNMVALHSTKKTGTATNVTTDQALSTLSSLEMLKQSVMTAGQSKVPVGTNQKDYEKVAIRQGLKRLKLNPEEFADVMFGSLAFEILAKAASEQKHNVHGLNTKQISDHAQVRLEKLINEAKRLGVSNVVKPKSPVEDVVNYIRYIDNGAGPSVDRKIGADMRPAGRKAPAFRAYIPQ